MFWVKSNQDRPEVRVCLIFGVSFLSNCCDFDYCFWKNKSLTKDPSEVDCQDLFDLQGLSFREL